MLFEIFLAVIVSSIQCSLVVDTNNQNGIHLSDYCPKMKYCPEGAHVMCMFYDPNKVMGPKCRDARNVSITPTLANKLLDVTNALRSKVSQGVEKGKHGEILPRGYGVFRLRWDSELATFAQLLANQCLLRHDFCRATKKFPDPGQTASVVRFHPPDWIPASRGGNFTNKGLTEEKLLYAITQSLRTWYLQKSGVTIDMVTNYPDFSKQPNDLYGMLYLTMVYGSTTHMGCGISAYTDYVYYSKQAHLLYNSVLVICNFSAQPRKNTGVYNTVPPTDTDSSFNACGCPVGSIEDDDCLCLEVPKEQEKTPLQKSKPCPVGIDCGPTVVLLPIITVEDAPPDKLVINGRRASNTSVSHIIPDLDIADSFEELFDQSGDKRTLRKSRKTLDLPNGNPNGKKLRPVLHGTAVTVRNRRFDKPNEVVEHKYSIKDHNDNKKHTQKSSVFSKTPIFELRGSHYFLSSIKRDVVPRKDFSTGKQLVNKIYFHNKNGIGLHKETHKLHGVESTVKHINEGKSGETTHNLHFKEHKTNTEHQNDVHFHDILVTTETALNTVEQKIMKNKNSKEMNLLQDSDKSDKVTEESDKKFMVLLDTLEQEVKYLDLDDKEKQIFDAKIKKIYGKVVGKPSSALVAHDKRDADHLKHINRNSQKKNDNDDIVRNLPPTFGTNNDNNIIDEINYQNKFNTETETDDKYLKTDKTDEQDEFYRPLVKKQTSIHYNGRDNFNRQSRGFGRNNHNYIQSSLESMRNRYDNEVKVRTQQRSKKDMYKKTIRNNYEKLRHRSNSLDFKRNKEYYSDGYEDILSTERIKYYQDKLDSMERKLQNARRLNRRKEAGRSPHMRALKPSFNNQINPLYTGRARILHGY